MQPIGAQREYVAGKHLDVAGLDVDEKIGAQRAAQQMARGSCVRLPGRSSDRAALVRAPPCDRASATWLGPAGSGSSANRRRARSRRGRSAARRPPVWSPWRCRPGLDALSGFVNVLLAACTRRVTNGPQRFAAGACGKPATRSSTAVREATSPESWPPTPSARANSQPCVRAWAGVLGWKWPR